ncbi:CPBP family intramembrane metalloprotease [Dactylosporangium sp. NBC_01737]|uniref:type II CAAX endopeptidase family protein n=1 Tax=Dactylosporangium sp. NBC_01737 TaxID=2975959 RepID=UPI002E15E068|nr:CPBP family intramembrane metalloprotease [Dactylosporangium sp. NBC_01737]
MFPNLTAPQKAAGFYLIALSMSTVLALIVPSEDGAALFGMFSPLVAVLVMLLVVTPDGRRREHWRSLGVHRLGLRSWPVAMLLPTAILVVGYLVAAAAGLAGFDLGAMAETDVVGDFVVGLAITVVLGLGEEIGWRGYMLPLVRQRLPRGGALVVGFLHGVWHLPLFLLTGYLAGIPGSPLVIIPVFLVTLTAAGAVYAWLRDRSGSVWSVVLMHQTFNTVNEAVMRGATLSVPVAFTYTTGETGVVTTALVIAVAFGVSGMVQHHRGGVRAPAEVTV